MSGDVRFVSGPSLLMVYALTSTLGLVLIKSGLGDTARLPLPALIRVFGSIRFISGFMLYVLSFAAWIGVLAMMPLSIAYPLAVGLTMALSTLGAVALLGERLDWTRLLGLACVFAAVLLFSMGRQR